MFKASRTGTISAVFRYSVHRKQIDLTLGHFDESGRQGITLSEARDRAGELQRMIKSGISDPRAYLAEQARLAAEEKERLAAEAKAAAETAQRERDYLANHRLRDLCDAYVHWLTDQGKYSDRAARSVFTHWVYHFDVADKPAKDITPDDVANLIRRPHEAGRARVPDALRAYLAAAFNQARRAKYDPRLPRSLVGFEVTTNPVDLIPSVPAKAGTRVLTMTELRAFLAALRDEVQGERVLKIALLAGGQRLMQLARVPVTAFDPEAGTITLEDRKGGRLEPRQHTLPLGPVALRLVKENAERAKAKGGRYLFAAKPDAPEPLKIIGIGDLMRATVARLKDIKPFTWRDVRRSCETGLAGLGISKDTRSQLLSHNLGTVTDRHYDRFDYDRPKREALLAWEDALRGIEPKSATVSYIRRRA